MKHRFCIECGVPVFNWRACALKPCSYEVCYCDAHGGPSKSLQAMIAHIQSTHILPAKKTPPAKA